MKTLEGGMGGIVLVSKPLNHSDQMIEEDDGFLVMNLIKPYIGSWAQVPKYVTYLRAARWIFKNTPFISVLVVRISPFRSPTSLIPQLS